MIEKYKKKEVVKPEEKPKAQIIKVEGFEEVCGLLESIAKKQEKPIDLSITLKII